MTHFHVDQTFDHDACNTTLCRPDLLYNRGNQCVYVMGPMIWFALKSGSTWRIHQWLNVIQLNVIVLNIGFKTNFALSSLWIRVEVEGFRYCHIYKLELWSCWFLFSVLKLSLTPKSHIYLDWNLESLPTYTPKFARATLQFLGSGGDGSLEWHMLSFQFQF